MCAVQQWNVPPVTWSQSAFKHNEITADEILWAMTHPHHVAEEYAEPRVPGGPRPDLYIGPSRFGTLEVLATVTPPNRVHIFHAMPISERTRAATGWNPQETPQEAEPDDEDT